MLTLKITVANQLIDDIRLLAKGFQVVPGSFWERVGECESETHGRDTIHVIDANLLEGVHVNQYLVDEENFFAARVLSHDGNKIRIKDLGRERLMSRQGVGCPSQERLSGNGFGCNARSAHRSGLS